MTVLINRNDYGIYKFELDGQCMIITGHDKLAVNIWYFWPVSCVKVTCNIAV